MRTRPSTAGPSPRFAPSEGSAQDDTERRFAQRDTHDDAGAVAAEVLLKHYAMTGPLMERAFGSIPFVWSTLPRGFDGPTIFHGPLSPLTRPKAPVVDVPTASGIHRYPALAAARIEGLVRHGAVEFYSWSPVAAQPTRVRFARLLLETAPKGDPRALEAGLALVEDALNISYVRWLRIFDGGTGVALWIPFCDAPPYESVRTWLRYCCEDAVSHGPDVLTLEPNSHGGPPVHLHLQSNAVGRFSILPYSVRATRGYPVAIPIDPKAVRNPFVNGSVRVENFADWVHSHGEPFATEPAVFCEQRFSDVGGPVETERSTWGFSAGDSSAELTPPRTHGPIVRAAIAVLEDGRAYTAEEILAAAQRRGFLDSGTTRKYVYTSLIEYIARANGNGRKPAIAQNGDRTFRMNEPPDEWPDVQQRPLAPCTPAIAALIERLHRSA
jgi:DNA primase